MKWKTVIMTAALVGLLFSPMVVVQAEEERPTASVDVAFLSKYVWRGWELSDGSLVIQPSVSVGYKGFGLNIWGNLDTDTDEFYGYDKQNKWTETDFTLSYDHSFGPFGLGVGYIYYALDSGPDDGIQEIKDTQEFYLSGSLDVLLSPSLTIYKDVDAFPDDWYVNFLISHSFPLPQDLSLELAGSVGYFVGDDDDYFQDGNLSAALAIPVGKYFTISPTIAYTFALSDDAEDIVFEVGPSEDSSYFYGGVNVSFAF